MQKKLQNKDVKFKYNLDRHVSKKLSYVYQLLVPENTLKENCKNEQLIMSK